MRNRPREIMIITPTGGTAAHMRYPGFRTLRVPKAHHVPRASCCSYTLYTLGSRPGGDIPSTKRDQRDLREQPLCCSRQRANSISAPPLYDLWRVALHATMLLYTMSIVVGCVLTTRVPYLTVGPMCYEKNYWSRTRDSLSFFNVSHSLIAFLQSQLRQGRPVLRAERRGDLGAGDASPS